MLYCVKYISQSSWELAYFWIEMESELDIIVGFDIMKLRMESELSVNREGYMKNRLEELRKQRGIKQEDLASALEVSRQTIGSLENGRYNPSIILAFKIARYFDMSIEDIFIYEEEKLWKKHWTILQWQ